MEYLTFENVLTIGGLIFFVVLWIATMAAIADESQMSGNPEERGPLWNAKVKSVFRLFGYVMTVLVLAVFALASLVGVVMAARHYELFEFLRAALLFFSLSITLVLFFFDKTTWVREIRSGRSRLSKAIYVIMALGFLGPLILQVFSAVAKW